MDQLRFGWIRKSENENWNDGFTILDLRCRIYDLRFWIYELMEVQTFKIIVKSRV